MLRADRFPHRDRNFQTIYHQNKTCALHLYDYHATMRLGDLEFEIAPRTLTLSPAGLPTSYDVRQDGYHWCIHFEPVAANGPCVKLALRQNLGDEHRQIVQQLADIARLHALSFRTGLPGKTAAAAASAALQSLLLRLAMFPDEQEPASRTAADAAIEHVLAIINERLDHDLRMPELAAEAGLSQNYLARCFRQQFGSTIPRYILRRRIDLARQLLRGTDLPVKVVAAHVGMPDSQHFNKQFRQFTGMSPSLYRSHARQDELLHRE